MTTNTETVSAPARCGDECDGYRCFLPAGHEERYHEDPSGEVAWVASPKVAIVECPDPRTTCQHCEEAVGGEDERPFFSKDHDWHLHLECEDAFVEACQDAADDMRAGV